MKRRVTIEWSDTSLKARFDPPLPQRITKYSLEACLRADRALGRLVRALNRAYDAPPRKRKPRVA